MLQGSPAHHDRQLAVERSLHNGYHAASRSNSTTTISSLCVPTSMVRMNSSELSAFIGQLWRLDEAVFGSCAGACWLQEARLCRMLRATRRQECEVVPYCSYDRGTRACSHRTFEWNTQFDFAVKRLYG